MGGAAVIGLAHIEGGSEAKEENFRDWIMLSLDVLNQLGLHLNRRYADGRELGPLV
ncbi:MAG: hypothetical protein L3K16_04950 [Thermoplasmata archaeon]|nr:hypothetical protein [Thermoplasmata archaeon]